MSTYRKSGASRNRKSGEFLLLPGQKMTESKKPESRESELGFKRLLDDLDKTKNGFDIVHKLFDAMFSSQSVQNPASIFNNHTLQPCFKLKAKYDKAKETKKALRRCQRITHTT